MKTNDFELTTTNGTKINVRVKTNFSAERFEMFDLIKCWYYTKGSLTAPVEKSMLISANIAGFIKSLSMFHNVYVKHTVQKGHITLSCRKSN